MKNKHEVRVHLGAVEFRKAGEGDGDGLGTLEGYAAVYDSPSEDLGGFVEVVARGAFARALGDDAEEVLAYADHDPARRLGRTGNGSLRLSDDERGLKVEIDLPNTSTGRDMAEEVRTGLVRGMSFGFRVIKDKWEERAEGGYLRTLLDVDLAEVSAVGVPAYPDTTLAKRGLEEFRARVVSPAPAPSFEEWRRLAMQKLRLARG